MLAQEEGDMTTATITEWPEFRSALGDFITVETVNQAQVGSVFSYDTRDIHYRKTGENEWERWVSGVHHSTSTRSQQSMVDKARGDARSYRWVRLITTPEFTVGQELPVGTDYSALPVGIRVTFRGSDAYYEKVSTAEPAWRSSPSNSVDYSNALSTARRTVIALPAEQTEPGRVTELTVDGVTLRVGDRVRANGVLLPVGSRVIDRSTRDSISDNYWERTNETTWRNHNADGSLMADCRPHTHGPGCFSGWTISRIGGNEVGFSQLNIGTAEGETVTTTAIAEQLTTEDQLNALAIGAVITTDSGNRATKRRDGDWDYVGSNGVTEVRTPYRLLSRSRSPWRTAVLPERVLTPLVTQAIMADEQTLPDGTHLVFSGSRTRSHDYLLANWDRLVKRDGAWFKVNDGTDEGRSTTFEEWRGQIEQGHWILHTLGSSGPAVGSAVTTETLRDCPVGSQIIRRTAMYERTGVGTRFSWTRSGRASADYGDGDFVASAYTWARWGPAPVVPEVAAPAVGGITVGQMLDTREQFALLPIGSVIRERGEQAERQQHYVKVTNSEWYHSESSAPYERTYRYGGQDSFSLSYNLVVRIGEIPATPAGCPAVGTYLSTREQVIACPVGTVISRTSSSLVKMEPDRWQDPISGERYYNRNISLHTSHRVISYPDTPATSTVPLGCPAVGTFLSDRSQAVALPVGTVITWRGDANLVKIGSNGWARVSRPTNRLGGDAWLACYDDFHQVVSYPGTTTTTIVPDLDAVERVKAEATAAINDCVRRESWAWVRDGGFRLLGILPMPALDTDVSYGSAFGLPVGSLVRCGRNLFRVDNNESEYPNVVHGSPRDMSRESMVRVVWLGEFTPPVYTGRNDFLRQLWIKQRELRSRHSWCSAVENCLNNAGLPDPGDTPDVAPIVLPAVGETFEAVGDAEQARLDALPVGSTVSVARVGIVVRSDGRWVRAADLTTYRLGGRTGVTVNYIPE